MEASPLPARATTGRVFAIAGPATIAMGGSEAVTRAAKTYLGIRIWSAPLVLINHAARGGLAAARYPALLKASFTPASPRR
jgi:Na+-driven multidrug efflux pump